jgi:hypothetical protein
MTGPICRAEPMWFTQEARSGLLSLVGVRGYGRICDHGQDSLPVSQRHREGSTKAPRLSPLSVGR